MVGVEGGGGEGAGHAARACSCRGVRVCASGASRLRNLSWYLGLGFALLRHGVSTHQARRFLN